MLSSNRDLRHEQQQQQRHQPKNRRHGCAVLGVLENKDKFEPEITAKTAEKLDLSSSMCYTPHAFIMYAIFTEKKIVNDNSLSCLTHSHAAAQLLLLFQWWAPNVHDTPYCSLTRSLTHSAAFADNLWLNTNSFFFSS